MSWFDKIQANLQDVATKAGLTPDKLKSITDTLNQELAKVPDHAKALKATAEQHGIEVGKIQEALSHAGAELTKAVDSAADQIGNKKP
jgi:ABC-type transporter Mla subunit MlaD